MIKGIFIFLFFLIFIEENNFENNFRNWSLYIFITFCFMIIIIGIFLISEIKEIRILGFERNYGYYNDSFLKIVYIK